MAKKRIDGGRPTVMTDKTLVLLEQAFSIGATNAEACCHAGISESVYYDYIRANPKFSDKIKITKQRLPLRAKQELSTHIEAGDKQTVQWYLERKRKDEFSVKTEVQSEVNAKIEQAIDLSKLETDDLLEYQRITQLARGESD